MPTARSTGTDYRTWSYLRSDMTYRSKTAHTSPTDPGIEAVAADAPDNGYGGV